MEEDTIASIKSFVKQAVESAENATDGKVSRQVQESLHALLEAKTEEVKEALTRTLSGLKASFPDKLENMLVTMAHGQIEPGTATTVQMKQFAQGVGALLGQGFQELILVHTKAQAFKTEFEQLAVAGC